MKNLSIVMERQRGLLALIICFLISCQDAHSVGLAFDNQLVIVASDCYTRIAIGSKLPDADIFFSVAVVSISECEEECSKKRNSCNAFAFGIGIKGNGTCALSAKMPKPEDLQFHADYDVYVRSQRSPHCEPDRLYKMGSGIEQGRRNETRPAMRFGSGLLSSTMPSMLSSPRTMENMMPNVANNPSYQQGYMPSIDEERRVSDILRNKNPMPSTSNPFGTNNAKIDDLSIYSNRKSAFGQRTHLNPNNGHTHFGGSSIRNPLDDVNRLNFALNSDNDLHSYKALTVHNGPFEVFSRPILVQDGTSKNKSPTDLEFWSNHSPTKYGSAIANHFNRHQYQGFLNNVHKNYGIIAKQKQNELVAGNYDIGKASRPFTSNFYNFDINDARISNGGYKDSSEIWKPGLSSMFRDFGARITEKTKSCYRRLLSGKKSLELHVRRTIECERIEDCHRACDYEKFFVCQGFNYRRTGNGARGMCEMTSVPYSRMDLRRDFISDPQCDYYEKDPNCVTNAPETRASWWNQQPSRPSQSYGPSYSINERPDTRPYAPNRHPSSEVPRPLDYARRPTDHDRRPPTIYGDSHPVLYDDQFGQRNYPIARPEDRFSYSGRFPSRRPADNFYDRNLPWPQYPKYAHRRIDHGPTHDIGTNEIGSYLPDHRKNPSRDWGSYGTVYGGSYGYDTNYVSKFDIPKYYPKPQPKPPRVFENDRFYGEFYNYGGAFGYGDNYIPASQDPLYGGTGKINECSVRAGAGFRLSRGVVRKTYLTPNLDQCESLCINEKNYVCMSFSYRYNVAPTDPTDNCLLSDVSYKDLNFYTDLEPDRDYDVYAVVANSRTCGTHREPNRHPPDECFWRVRSGFGMPTDVVRKIIIVNNLGECQAECAIAQQFTCRSFAFKYGLEQERQDAIMNCYLSDWQSQDINPANMPDMDGAELYERGSFGRGCEPYTIPFFNTGRFNGKQSLKGDEVCYSGYNKPCKLTPYAVLLATYVNSEQNCRQKCSGMRESNSIPCMSYSYKLTTHGTEENCLLSDLPVRDLRPGLDYIYDDDYVLYAWKDLDPQCLVMDYSIDDHDHVFGGPGPSRPLLPGPSRPDLSSDSYPSAKPGKIYPDPRPFFAIWKPNDYHHGARPFDPDKPDPIRPYRPGGGYGSYGDKFGYGIRPSVHGSFYPDDHSTFRYYTVNGYPCKRGTKCEKNKVAGFWACETEGSEYGSWDYCCAPTHHCGFSQGYHYPWCYVGIAEDQWRPCSEKYFPYLPSPRPIRPPTIGSDDRFNPHDSSYYGRHWPITYLHPQSPPNCTDSLASADNSGDHRSNKTTPMDVMTTPKPNSTESEDAANSTTTARTRRRRLPRLRTALVSNDRNDRMTFSRKIGSQVAINNERNVRERPTKIEGILKLTSSESLRARATSAPLTATIATTANNTGAQFKWTGAGNDANTNSGGMIRVPLIVPNNSLPARV